MDAKLIVKSRDEKGSANARRMRRAGMIPGVIYSNGNEAREVSLSQHEFKMMLHHHAGEQMMVAIKFDGKDESVLLKDVQHAALSGDILHVDFQEVSLTEKLKVQIAIELIGEAEGVITQGGVLDHTLYSVEVACLPSDILNKIEVDVSELKLGDVLTVKDIAIDTVKYEILMDGDTAVASVLQPRVVVDEDEEGAEGSTGPEVITEKKEEGAE